MYCWLIDPHTRCFHNISLKRDYGKIDYDYLREAFLEGVHPCEYNFVKDLLGASSVKEISLYTVRQNSSYVYNVWYRKDKNVGPGVRIFTSKKVFYDNCLLVKYKRTTIEELNKEKLKDFVNSPRLDLFYEPNIISKCELPQKIKFICD